MSDSNIPEIPDFDALAADPEIAPLLRFEPVVRKVKRPDGWTPELQRELIARIAAAGTLQQAVWQMGKHATGAEALYKTPSADSFRASWDAAIIIGRRRNGLDSQPPFIGNVPGIQRRTKSPSPLGGEGRGEGLPGQVLNERGEYEDEESLRRRAEEAKDSISAKLLRCRRLYLQEICSSPGKRAAFEILTELAIDWEKAAALEPQADEPFRKPNMRAPDMLLTAENGWMGDMAHGPNRMAEAREALNAELIARGEEPIDWESENAEDKTDDGEADASACSRDVEPVRPTTGEAVSIDVTNSVRDGATSSPSPSPTPPDKPVPSSSRRPGPRIRGL